jgi:DNA-binding LytR/AlgR family response regulator
MTPARAIIAEDEPLLAAGLEAALSRLWPQLQVVARVTNGAAALQMTLEQRPDVLFLDIRMPGLSGLEVAESLAEDWQQGPLPLTVFVTAYEQHALRAFEHAAVDYVLKPVDPDRLAVTCRRLQATLASRDITQPVEVPAALLAALKALRDGGTHQDVPKLRMLQASLSDTIHMVPVAEVLYFEAADKYIRVVTAERDYLIRISLRQLLRQLSLEEFWQIHRSVVVRVDAIATAARDDTGRVELTLKGHPAKLCVSRLYAHLFRAM